MSINVSAINTGGSHLSCTAVKLDSHLAHIFCQKCTIQFLSNLMEILVLISWITNKQDRFLCSQNIWIKWDPPVHQ